MEEMLMQEAGSYGREFFASRSEQLPVNTIDNFHNQLQSLRDEALVLVRRGAGKEIWFSKTI